jgi:hypothetical protein
VDLLPQLVDSIPHIVSLLTGIDDLKNDAAENQNRDEQSRGPRPFILRLEPNPCEER